MKSQANRRHGATRLTTLVNQPQQVSRVTLAIVGVALAATLVMAGSTAFAQALPASVAKPVAVPQNMKQAPFDVARNVNVPPGMRLEMVARINKARFLLPLPNGDLLVSVPAEGKIKMIRRAQPYVNNGNVTVTDFVGGLTAAHDMVLHTIDNKAYLYIGETQRVIRVEYVNGDTQMRPAQTIVSGLPDASLPELGGAYGHPLKNIALDSQHRLYVSIASASNADANERNAAIERASIYVYNADGTNGQRFGRGIRNAEGLAFKPGTDDLWVVVNNRDNIGYPYQRDFDGDGSNDYGKVMQSFVDNNPPELFARVWANRDLGWPLCNASNERGVDMMTFDRDVQNNADGSKLNCNNLPPIEKGIQAHSAPLGVSFLQDSGFAKGYRNGAVAGLHGSWNRAVKTGYKVTYYPWDDTNNKPGAQLDLVSGFITNNNTVVWGRPVDAVPGLASAGDKALYISDDYANAVYALVPDSGNTTDSDKDGTPDFAEVEEGTSAAARDNDVFNNSRLFVRQLYRDLLARESEASGLSFFTGQIDSGSQTRSMQATMFISSTEYRATTLALARLYLTSFDRFGDPDGLRFWQGQLNSGKSMAEIALAFSNNQELVTRYGNLNNAQYVDLIYRNTLGRDGDTAGRTYWTNRLNSSAETRASLLQQFANSQELIARRDPQLLPALQAILLGNRNVTQQEVQTMVNQMAQGTTLEQLVRETMATPGYRARFL